MEKCKIDKGSVPEILIQCSAAPVSHWQIWPTDRCASGASGSTLQKTTAVRLEENMPIELWQGLLIPFAGTTLGVACVLFIRRRRLV